MISRQNHVGHSRSYWLNSIHKTEKKDAYIFAIFIIILYIIMKSISSLRCWRDFSKHDVDGRKNVFWKCILAFLQSFHNYWNSLCLQTFSNYPGIKFGTNTSDVRGQNWTFVIIWWRRPHNWKTGHFTLWKERERLRNVQIWKMHVQSVQNCYCFSLSNMHICDVLVTVAVVVA